jgi:putative acetyltransferase
VQEQLTIINQWVTFTIQSAKLLCIFQWSYFLEIIISPIEPNEEAIIQELVQTSMLDYIQGSYAAATYRRLENLYSNYTRQGHVMLIAHSNGQPIGAAGVGPLHGLSPQEHIAEIRDIVVKSDYRNQGIGARLVKSCIEFAKSQDYKTLYLETTPPMKTAKRLFERLGFRPVVEKRFDGSTTPEDVPGYFILEHL